MITMLTPYTSPGLRSNDRHHWRVKAQIVREIRMVAAAEASKHAPITEPVTITLIWEVTDKRRRDVGASSPFLKAWIDGCVDGGLIPRDSHDVVTEERLRIEVGTKRGVRVEITPVKGDEQ
jgi:hypothetical protein